MGREKRKGRMWKWEARVSPEHRGAKGRLGDKMW